MVTNFCAASLHDTVGSYLDKVRKCHTPISALPYIYVTNEHGALVGVIDLDVFLMSPHGEKIIDIMNEPKATVFPHSERERVGALVLEHGFKAIPVVDHQKKLLGIIPEKSIFQIFREDHVAEFLKAAGVHRGANAALDVLHAKLYQIIKARLPWLLIGLIGGMLAAYILKFFEAELSRKIALAFFIPAIVYIGDAVGTQTEALFIRSHILAPIRFTSYIFKEAFVGFFIGLIIGAINFLFAAVLFGETKLALAVGLSTFATIFASVFVAIGIPSLLIKLKKSPEIGTGPFATIIQDVLSVTIYLAISNALL